MSYFYIPLLFFFIVISNVFPTNILDSRGELGVVEILQISILFICCVIHLKYRKRFLRKYNFISFFSRLSVLIFLFYEEISFLTWNRSNIFNVISNQDEINFHNLKILATSVIQIPLPFNNIFTLNFYNIIIIIVLLFFGFGSFSPKLKNLEFLFLEKRLSIYSLVFLVNLLITRVLKIAFIDSSYEFIQEEICELFIYFLLLGDYLEKRKKLSKI